jgi:hypothetical protein
MNNNFPKIFLALLAFFFFSSSNAQNQPVDNQTLAKADSLFANKRYTEALENYEVLYATKQTSPAMLLRMAFIHEGLDQVVESMYYLNQYYQISADRDAIRKITELAEANELRGYQYSDGDYIINLLNRYQQWVIALLASLLLLTAIILWKRKAANASILPPMVFQTICAVALLVFINGILDTEEGIIRSSNTVLMNGPGAGAEPITVLGAGHKVTVLKQEEVWTKIAWNETIGYVRNHRIMPI